METPKKHKVDPAALARKDSRLASMLDAAKTALSAKVSDRFDDAEAHAENALTTVAKAAADGRPTVAAIRKNRSHEAARKRLFEIADLVAATVRAARRAFFAECAEGWRKTLDSSMLRESPQIAGMVSAAADELVSGRIVLDDCKIQATRAADDLERALVQASSRSANDRDAEDLLRRWSARWGSALTQHAMGLLEDAAYRCDYLSGRAVCKPGLLHPDPTIPWE